MHLALKIKQKYIYYIKILWVRWLLQTRKVRISLLWIKMKKTCVVLYNTCIFICVLSAFTSVIKWVMFLFVWLIFLLMWMNNCSFLPHTHVFPWQNGKLFQHWLCVFLYYIPASLKRDSCTASQQQRAQDMLFEFLFPQFRCKSSYLTIKMDLSSTYTKCFC